MTINRCPKHGVKIPDWGYCPRCAEQERNWNRYDDSFGFRKKRPAQPMGQWQDSGGTAHGEQCRIAFYETTCRYCHQDTWYFECTHGCRVFFHDVPWWGGHWATECPGKGHR